MNICIFYIISKIFFKLHFDIFWRDFTFHFAKAKCDFTFNETGRSEATVVGFSFSVSTRRSCSVSVRFALGAAIPYRITLLVIATSKRQVHISHRYTTSSFEFLSIHHTYTHTVPIQCVTFHFSRYSLTFFARGSHHPTTTFCRLANCKVDGWFFLEAQSGFGFLLDGRQITSLLVLEVILARSHIPDVRFPSPLIELRMFHMCLKHMQPRVMYHATSTQIFATSKESRRFLFLKYKTARLETTHI